MFAEMAAKVSFELTNLPIRPLHPSRRQLLAGFSAAAGVHLSGIGNPAFASNALTRLIPSSGVPLPVIGMGSWLTFDVRRNAAARAQRTGVLQAFFDAGGGMIDSSPMYGTSEEVIGYCLKRVKNPAPLFSATKVWTVSRTLGIRQMKASQKLWGLDSFDLIHIHNMLDWQTHLATLKDMKADGRVRHIGITTSHGRRHDAFAKAMQSEPFDFVQFTYNILNRQAEERLLPLAQDRGQAVVINRPFERGGLFRHVAGKPLPEWAAGIGCKTWAQFFLKFIISHPAVTCAIPATTRVDHMRENMAAGHSPLPNPAMRMKMAAYVEAL